jgi:hypothetical protein
MNGKTLLVAALAAVLASGIAAAQGAKGPKLYRWVDKEGKVHYDDALPPEAVNQARKEFNAKTGSVAGQVDRALTAEERAAQAAAALEAEKQAALAEDHKRQETVMMATYTTENDLRRAYGERIALLKTTLDSTDVSIRNVRENLATMLAQASDVELSGQKVGEERAAAIRSLHDEFLKQQSFQANRRLELDALNAEFARMLVRYRELKSAPPAPPSGVPLSNAAPPPGG